MMCFGLMMFWSDDVLEEDRSSGVSQRSQIYMNEGGQTKNCPPVRSNQTEIVDPVCSKMRRHGNHSSDPSAASISICVEVNSLLSHRSLLSFIFSFFDFAFFSFPVKAQSQHMSRKTSLTGGMFIYQSCTAESRPAT